jgi:hypothetical protein
MKDRIIAAAVPPTNNQMKRLAEIGRRASTEALSFGLAKEHVIGRYETDPETLDPTGGIGGCSGDTDYDTRKFCRGDQQAQWWRSWAARVYRVVAGPATT